MVINRFVVGYGLGILLIVLGSGLWYFQTEQEKQQQENDVTERAEYAKKIREDARLLEAKRIKTPIVVQEDPMEPHESSDEEELAQAKLWQEMPKDKRKLLDPNTSSAP